MDKIHSHLDGDLDRLLVFKRQWLRMHPNAYKGSSAQQAAEDKDL
jgi:hypothetical protein